MCCCCDWNTMCACLYLMYYPRPMGESDGARLSRYYEEERERQKENEEENNVCQ